MMGFVNPIATNGYYSCNNECSCQHDCHSCGNGCCSKEKNSVDREKEANR